MTGLELLEWTAVVLNIAFTIGIAYEKRWAWVPGFVASCIGVGLYALQHTWALCALNGYYVVMAAYGWWSWGRPGPELPVTRRKLPFHAALLAGLMAATWLLATLLATQLNGAYPGLDAFITAFSLAATWMMARKYVENWLYWVVGDAVAVYLNWRIGYDAYAVLNVIYIALSIAGLVKWMRKMNAPL
jgi:nicotinamide mononucleotide transporter